MHILLADDHSMFRSGLRRIIGEQFPSAQIEEAASCGECLQKVSKGSWQLIILDISMQNQDSLTILPDIRKLHPHVPILILTMHSDRHFVLQALRAGASGYLTKEHTDDELIRAIDTVVRGNRYVSSTAAEELLDYLTVGRSELPHESLSAREREVFILIASGRSLSEIAGMLSLSAKTVSTYRTRVLEKMGMGSNADLTRYALRQGLIK